MIGVRPSWFIERVLTHLVRENVLKGHCGASMSADVRLTRIVGLVPLLWLLGSLAAPLAHGMNCQHVRTLTSAFLQVHFSHNTLDDELSRRTLENYLKAWDPGKVYFLEADVKALREKYATKLDDMILANKCEAITDIVNVYSKRFEERQKLVAKYVKADHDFTIDEHMMIDRKKIKYAKNTEELAERWRQRIKFQALQLKNTLGDMAKVKDKLKKRYELVVKRHNELSDDDLYEIFLGAFATSLDPHSSYYSPDALEDFRISTRLSLEGIGAVLRSEDGMTIIQSMVPGGAAAKTGKIKVDDKIIEVSQGSEDPVDVVDMDLREVVKLIRGTGGTEVRLTVVRETNTGNVQLIIPIIREKIQLSDRAAKSKVYPVKVGPGGNGKAQTIKVGVIELPSFYMDFEGRENNESNFKSSSKDMLKEIRQLQKEEIGALVIDLRSNGGGSLDESINIAGQFFDKGPVVQVKDQLGASTVLRDSDPSTIWDGPLVVMIDRQSASASEIFAGAIQDYGRGLIIGDSHTFGKGTVQNVQDLDPRLGAIKVTISKFYRPSGSSTQLRGVEADIALPSVVDEYDIGEKHYDYALPWEQITASKYGAVSKVSPYLATLLKASKKRVATDEGFKSVLEAIQEYKDNESMRAKVSLKEETKDVATSKASAATDQVASKDQTSPKDKALSKDGKEREVKDSQTQTVDKRESDKLDKAESLAKGEQEPEPLDGADDFGPEGEGIPFEEDYHLQETLRIAADYVQLLNKKSLGKISIPELKKASVAAASKAPDKAKVSP